MRISDWSSDLCSSDLRSRRGGRAGHSRACRFRARIVQRVADRPVTSAEQLFTPRSMAPGSVARVYTGRLRMLAGIANPPGHPMRRLLAAVAFAAMAAEIGSASCRDRVGKYV